MAANKIQARLEQIEFRLDALEKRIAELEGLQEIVGDLKYEVEQMVEA